MSPVEPQDGDAIGAVDLRRTGAPIPPPEEDADAAGAVYRSPVHREPTAPESPAPHPASGIVALGLVAPDLAAPGVPAPVPVAPGSEPVAGAAVVTTADAPGHPGLPEHAGPGPHADHGEDGGLLLDDPAVWDIARESVRSTSLTRLFGVSPRTLDRVWRARRAAAALTREATPPEECP